MLPYLLGLQQNLLFLSLYFASSTSCLPLSILLFSFILFLLLLHFLCLYIALLKLNVTLMPCPAWIACWPLSCSRELLNHLYNSRWKSQVRLPCCAKFIVLLSEGEIERRNSLTNGPILWLETSSRCCLSRFRELSSRWTNERFHIIWENLELKKRAS